MYLTDQTLANMVPESELLIIFITKMAMGTVHNHSWCKTNYVTIHALKAMYHYVNKSEHYWIFYSNYRLISGHRSKAENNLEKVKPL